MFIAFLICFLAGATLMVCQLVLGLLGFGSDHGDAADHHDFHDPGHDVSHDSAADDSHADHQHGHESHSGSFLGMLTFRSIVAGLTFFGLVGMATFESFSEKPALNILAAAGSGFGVLYAVGFIMKSLHRLKSDGTARIERSVGQRGTVYLKVPGNKAGVGKVTLNLQNRTVEYSAVTPENELPTGARVQVVGVISPDTVEVVAATESLT